MRDYGDVTDIVLKSIKDFDPDNYNNTRDVSIKFEDSEDNITFGNVIAETHKGNAVSYGTGGSVALGGACAIAFGFGRAECEDGIAISYNHGDCIAHGTGTAITYVQNSFCLSKKGSSFKIHPVTHRIEANIPNVALEYLDLKLSYSERSNSTKRVIVNALNACRCEIERTLKL